MTDFKPGDEVVCVVDQSAWLNAEPGSSSIPGPVAWQRLVVEIVQFVDDEAYLGFPQWPIDSFRASFFRKVQRRDLSAWLATENTIEGPVRKREKVR